MVLNGSGNDTYRHRAAQFVDALKEVQDKFGDGYLSAFPREHFDRLESLKPVWAPYYVVRGWVIRGGWVVSGWVGADR